VKEPRTKVLTKIRDIRKRRGTNCEANAKKIYRQVEQTEYFSSIDPYKAESDKRGEELVIITN